MPTHNVTTSGATSEASVALPQLAAQMRLGATRLVVRDLARSTPFYQDGIGLQHLGTEAGVARLGTGEATVLELAEEPAAAAAGRHAGLFHVALLYPSRLELARVGHRLRALELQVDGASDHGSHEAFYLRDPDGNGLELAADRPRAQWPDPQEEYATGPQPLDVRGLMSLADGEAVVSRAADGLVVGHLHLHVGDVDDAIAFYRDVVGFDLKARLPTAAFVSVGGYHHHLGLNVWKGEGVPPAPDDALGMRFWTAVVPQRSDLMDLARRLDAAGIDHEFEGAGLAVRDPWNNELRVTTTDA